MSEQEPSILREAPAGAEPKTSEQAPSSQEERSAAETSEQAPESPQEERSAARPSSDQASKTRAAPRRGRSQAPTFYVAGFWHRLVAAAIDLAIIVPVVWLMSWLVGALAGIHLPASRHRSIDFWLDLLLANDPALLGIIGLTLAIATVYVLVFQITLAHTPGMRIMKIRIIDQYGDPPSVGRAAARTTGYLAATATLGLGFLWIGFDSEKRGLHDWLSGTYIVKA